MLPQSPSFFRRLFRHRSTSVTAEGIQFLIFTLAIGIAAVNTGNNLFYLLLAMMLSLVLISGIMAEYCLRQLEFHRHLPDHLIVNEPATVTLVVKNRKMRLPSFSLEVLDVSDGRTLDRGAEIRHLVSGASQLVSYSLVAPRRGRLRLDGVCVRTEFPFGLFRKQTFYPIEETIIVCPEIKPIDEGLLRGFFTAGPEQSVHRRGQGNDMYNLRQYQAGDDSRKIHWPTTARTSQLMVRETEAEDQRRAVIYLPTLAPVSHDALFEQAVRLAASIIEHLAHSGYTLQLRVGSSRSPFVQGNLHRWDLLRMLAFCERCSPSTESAVTEELLGDTWEIEGGTMIVVQSWRGPSDIKPEHPTILIDGTIIAGTSYAV
ncbi:MAG: hypothetical protein A4E19_21195 [Nitrospira sp. SG-bin1]|nr:MAG: hypothetical protein A4E19_21195 [Nitrospira sp. SG-bin1]